MTARTILRIFRQSRLVYAAALLLASIAPMAEARSGAHGIAMHGEPLMQNGFAHFPYVNPAAPKGGRLTIGINGTFDSLNPFIVKGLPVLSIQRYVVETLMTRSFDEPFSMYGLLAETVETNFERSFMAFTLNPAARFSDGAPVTVQDVIFSYELLREKGRPNHRTYYRKVAKVEATGPRTVRFDLSGSDDRELPLILGLMPIFPKHATDPATFEQTSLAPIIGSGPYRVGEVKAGERITLVRDPNYWGRDLPINRGYWNFDEVRYDYYRDANTHFEAFKRGLYDVRAEFDPGRWQSGYDFPAVQDGRVIKDKIASGLPHGMLAWVFNTRRPIFADPLVREAINLLFDFEWVNRNFFFDLYQRTWSFFEGSELSGRKTPASARERALLAAFKNELRADVLDGQSAPPVTDGSGRDRDTLKRALALLEKAGFELNGTELRERATGRPFSFEIMVTTKDQERLAIALQRDLKRAGIDVRLRIVDAVQFERRRQTFDFDMMQFEWSNSLSPGNEQSFYWGSAAADEQGSRNYMGVKSPGIDAMIAAMLAAREREDFVAAVRALDRVLMSGFLVIPLFHLPEQWVARWADIKRPERTALFGYLPETWWRQPQTPTSTQ